VLLALVAVALVVRCDQDSPGPESETVSGERVRGRVIEVVDGDTVRVELAEGGIESVRYIGIDTPESNPDQPLECFGHEAERANAALVAGRDLDLELGEEPRDDYGRLLVYVRVGSPRGALVNAELVREGFARTLTIAPNDRLAPLLRRLETAAARAGRGLWAACIK